MRSTVRCPLVLALGLACACIEAPKYEQEAPAEGEGEGEGSAEGEGEGEGSAEGEGEGEGPAEGEGEGPAEGEGEGPAEGEGEGPAEGEGEGGGPAEGEGEGPVADCGNGLVEVGEECDGTDLGALTCVDTLALLHVDATDEAEARCARDCSRLRLQSCSCGNGTVEPWEHCDTDAVDWDTGLVDGVGCTDLALPDGVLRCGSACSWDIEVCAGGWSWQPEPESRRCEKALEELSVGVPETARLGDPDISGKSGLRRGTLDDFDLESNYFWHAHYSFALRAGEEVRVTVESAAFDAYLYVMDPDCVVVAENDDAHGDTTDAAARFTPPETRTWSVEVTSAQPLAGGDFTVLVDWGDG